MVIQDQRGSGLPRQKGPHPLHKDTGSKIGLGQIVKMNGSPDETREQPADVNIPGLQNRKPSTHDCHFTSIEISKWGWLGLTCYEPLNGKPCVTPLLHCDLCDARQRVAILLEISRITDDKDFGIAVDSERSVYAHAAGVIRIRAKPRSCRRSSYAGSPDDSLA